MSLKENCLNSKRTGLQTGMSMKRWNVSSKCPLCTSNNREPSSWFPFCMHSCRNLLRVAVWQQTWCDTGLPLRRLCNKLPPPVPLLIQQERDRLHRVWLQSHLQQDPPLRSRRQEVGWRRKRRHRCAVSHQKQRTQTLTRLWMLLKVIFISVSVSSPCRVWPNILIWAIKHLKKSCRTSKSRSRRCFIMKILFAPP